MIIHWLREDPIHAFRIMRHERLSDIEQHNWQGAAFTISVLLRGTSYFRRICEEEWNRYEAEHL